VVAKTRRRGERGRIRRGSRCMMGIKALEMDRLLYISVLKGQDSVPQ
jgi:hypothetical protein